MNNSSDDFRKELINKIKPCIHNLTMRPGLFRGEFVNPMMDLLLERRCRFSTFVIQDH